MAEFKVVISNPRDKDGKTYKRMVKGSQALSLIGKKIGDDVDGIFLGMPGYKLILTGGSDKDGFPMRRDVPGARRVKILITKGLGFRPKDRGVRKRKSIRGNTISQEIVLLNMKIKSGSGRPLAELLKEGEQEKEPEKKETRGRPAPKK
jgi:small subunit ribosomal protein S6e